MIDLWPKDIPTVKTKAPVTILREQATFLGQHTKNVVTAEVVRCFGIDVLKYAFYIVGPAIGNYRYRLFTMASDIELYPLTLVLHSGTLGATASQCVSLPAASQSELLAALRKVFSADKTLRVIRAILALSGVEPSE